MPGQEYMRRRANRENARNRRNEGNRGNGHYLGRMDRQCDHCDAFRWKDESSALCCANGQVMLPPLQPPPDQLTTLFTSNSAEAQHFRDNIRGYNSALAFASLGANEDILPPGVYCFRISGEIHHMIGPILPHDNEKPRFAQIYIYDADNETENRRHWNNGLNPDLLQRLQQLLHVANPFVQVYKHAADAIQEAGSRAGEVRMVLRADPSKDSRRYNLPQASEVAVILPDMPCDHTARDIILYRRGTDDPRGTNIIRISDIHPHYDPLHYVLLFPHGEEGWRINIPFNGNRTGQVTCMQFYTYRLMVRPAFNIILHGGRLLQQYVVDEYAKMELQRLRFLRFNQNTLRAELYQGLSDAVVAGDVEGATVGRRIVLPATFVGSPRSMIQLYQDAMSIVRKYGKPDLFITFTCNPNWPEIKNELKARQTPADRPDLVTRVFKMKSTAFMKDLVEHKLFGTVIAYVRVVEFQKRGLPHTHILLILDAESKPKTVEDVDKIVKAEIPIQQPLLRDLVERHMMHGPCGNANPNCSCMKDGTCSKSFPKDYANVTFLTENTYPSYQRRNNGAAVERNGAVLDNRWVVPYNPILLEKYEAHINVEVCNSITAVKYLYKYVYKGHDRIMVEFQGDQNDEIRRYVDARYVSASEACWRIFHFELQGRYPSIKRLALHLPNQQSVVYREGQAQQAVAHVKDTTLTAWFKANNTFPEARDLYYHQMPEKFTWDVKNNAWKP